MKPAQEAKCPDCGRWSPVAYVYLDDSDPIGGFWWAGEHAGCPCCGALALVESECDFRDAMTGAERDALEARVSGESAVLAQLGGER